MKKVKPMRRQLSAVPEPAVFMGKNAKGEKQEMLCKATGFEVRDSANGNVWYTEYVDELNCLYYRRAT